jgi:hypothetical protein
LVIVVRDTRPCSTVLRFAIHRNPTSSLLYLAVHSLVCTYLPCPFLPLAGHFVSTPVRRNLSARTRPTSPGVPDCRCLQLTADRPKTHPFVNNVDNIFNYFQCHSMILFVQWLGLFPIIPILRVVMSCQQMKPQGFHLFTNLRGIKRVPVCGYGGVPITGIETSLHHSASC